MRCVFAALLVPFTVNCFGVRLVETGSPKDDFRFRGLGFNSERESAFRWAMFFGKWFVGLWGYGLGVCCFVDLGFGSFLNKVMP